MDAYMRGTLDEASRKEFEEKLASDQAFREQWQLMQSMQQAVRITALQEKMEMLKKADEEGLKKKASYLTGTKSIRRWLILIFLFAGITAVAYFILRSPVKVQEPMAAHTDLMEQSIIHKTVRSAESGNNLKVEQRIAYDLYVLQEFEDAIPRLEQLWKNQSDTLAYFYLGASYFFTGRSDKAGRIFADPILAQDSIYAEKIKLLLNKK